MVSWRCFHYSKLAFNKHVNDKLSLYIQRFYLLKLLRDQYILLDSLTTIYRALVINNGRSTSPSDQEKFFAAKMQERRFSMITKFTGL
jgi:hypothetical protein